MTTTLERCPVCRSSEGWQAKTVEDVHRANNLSIEWQNGFDAVFWCNCVGCGMFLVSQEDAQQIDLDESLSAEARFRLSALLRERETHAVNSKSWLRTAGSSTRTYPALPTPQSTVIDIYELLREWPSSVGERLERALGNLAVSPPGQPRGISPADRYSQRLMFAPDEMQTVFLRQSLIDLGWCRWAIPDHVGDQVVITPAGWAKIDELTRGRPSSKNPAFVAMWFGAEKVSKKRDRSRTEMLEVYTNGIVKGVELAQYHVTRADLEEHDGGIIDKVMGDIRVAPFVVADFTGNRNGVYWEAGFARGLGRPVIHTCAKSHFKDAHFDVKHLNFIVWETVEELRERLFDRIRGTIGLGPYSPDAC